jgi:hypothetical protein
MLLLQVLHRITLHGRSSAELQAFFANLFNTLALHAWCIDRWPVSQQLLYPGCPCWRALRYALCARWSLAPQSTFVEHWLNCCLLRIVFRELSSFMPFLAQQPLPHLP